MKRKMFVLFMALVMMATMVVPVGATDEEETSVSIETPADPPAETPVEKPAEAPAEKPAETPAEKPADVPADDPAEAPDKDADQPQEPAEEPEIPEQEPEVPAEEPVPTQEPTEVPTAEPTPEPTPEPFSAEVRIELKNAGAIYFGDEVTLRAVVEQANAAYTVVWEYYNMEADFERGENPWVAIETGEEYSFVVTEENVATPLRAVVNGVVFSDFYLLSGVTARPEEEPEVPDAEPEVPGEEPVAELDPDREIVIRAEYEGEQLYFGDEVALCAELIGYENAVYTVQWETSEDGEDWTDVEDATELTYAFVLTEENWQNLWRLTVNVTGVIAEEA